MTDATILLTDLVVGESPRWHDDRLWFCHWGADELVTVDMHGHRETVPLDLSAKPQSIDWLPDGRLLVITGTREGAGRLLRQEPDGTLLQHADLTGFGLSKWNEIVVDGRGNIYVNNLCFDFMAFLERVRDADDQQRAWQERKGYEPGIIALITPDGSVRQVADGIEFPNGMVVTPDNRTLIVSESFAGRLTAFDIAADGGLSRRRVWADDIGPDGICLDTEGAIWTTPGTNACVRVREGGEILERIELDRAPFACMLGGPDGRTLFVMAAEWHPENPFGGPRTGRVLTAPAPAPHAGRP
ncbi:MAG: SMP-30/gluconolactonase/LRE family protein [Actinocatenispora sp.]